MAASDIPVGTQFSPDLIDLKAFVAAACQHSGDNDQLLDAVVTPPVRIKPYKSPPTRRQKSLPIEAAIQYGLLDEDRNVTDLTQRLNGLPASEIHEAFARHILLTRNGLRVVELAQQMAFEGLKITGDSLAEYATRHGLKVIIHNTAINTLRMWLEKAGLFKGRSWRVDTEAKRRLLGLDDDAIAGLTALNEEQRFFLQALCRLGPVVDQKAASVREMGEQATGTTLSRGNLPKNFLEPLADLGLITYTSKGTKGGKTALLTTTSKFEAEALADFLEHAIDSLDETLTEYFRRRPEDIFTDLESSDTAVKGAALEAFAVMVMRLMGLRFVAWRLRAKNKTGQAEVDVLMAGLVGGLATRWQVQCKNKPSGNVNLEDIAKEVGLLPLTKATHILVLANSMITRDARHYAQEVMKHSHVTIYLLDIDDFNDLRADPACLASVLREQSEQIVKLPRTGIEW